METRSSKLVRLINQNISDISEYISMVSSGTNSSMGSHPRIVLFAKFPIVLPSRPPQVENFYRRNRFRDPDTREKRDKSASTFYGSNLPWCPNERYFSRGGRRVLPLVAAQSVQRHLRGAPNRRRWAFADRLRAHWKRNRRFLRIIIGDGWCLG